MASRIHINTDAVCPPRIHDRRDDDRLHAIVHDVAIQLSLESAFLHPQLPLARRPRRPDSSAPHGELASRRRNALALFNLAAPRPTFFPLL